MGLKNKLVTKETIREWLEKRMNDVLWTGTYFIQIFIIFLIVSFIIIYFLGTKKLCILVFYTIISWNIPGDFAIGIIETIEIYLLGAILFIFSMWLYKSFGGKELAIPETLSVKDVDELKEKLLGIIITMLNVEFLKHIILWKNLKITLGFAGSVSLITISIALYMLVKKRGG